MHIICNYKMTDVQIWRELVIECGSHLIFFFYIFIFFCALYIYIDTHTIVHVGQHPSCSIYINNLAKRHSMYHKVLHEQVRAAHLSHNQSIRSDSFSVKIQYSNIWQGLDKLEWQPAWDIYMVINMQFKKSTLWILWK